MAWRIFGESHWDYSIVLAEAHEGLPRPAREIDCKVLEAPVATPLIVLGARHHDVGYYVIAKLAEAGCLGALKRVLKTRRLELGLTTNGVKPSWASLHFDHSPVKELETHLNAFRPSSYAQEESWRDQLAPLLLRLPALMARAHPGASSCLHHTAVLVSSDYGRHAARRQRVCKT